MVARGGVDRLAHLTAADVIVQMGYYNVLIGLPANSHRGEPAVTGLRVFTLTPRALTETMGEHESMLKNTEHAWVLRMPWGQSRLRTTLL